MKHYLSKPHRFFSLPAGVPFSGGPEPDQGTFPSPWLTINSDFLDNSEVAKRQLFDDFLSSHGFPRHTDLLVKWYAERIPDGARILIYPNGMVAQKLKESLADVRKDIEIVGYIDKNKSSIDLSMDRCWSPDEANKVVCDYLIDGVVIAHAVREPYFAEYLLLLGVEEKYIWRCFTHESFGTWYSAQDIKNESNRFSEVIPNPQSIDTIFLNPLFLGSNLINEEEISYVFPYERAALLRFHCQNPDLKDTEYATVPLYFDFRELLLWLEYVKPKQIYASSLVAENYLGALCKMACPEALYIHEFYDLSTCFPDSVMASNHAASTSMLAASRFGEYLAFKEADLIVSKRGGPHWRKLGADFSVPQTTFFQGLRKYPLDPDPLDRPGYEKIKIVYAGPVPSLSDIDQWPFYNFTNILIALATDQRVHLTVYNSFDNGGDEPGPEFRELSESLSTQTANYHPAVKPIELLQHMQSYDIGWMCLNTEADAAPYPDTRTVFSARMTGYVSAGLPVILDSTWEAPIELIEEYGAGFVISEPDPTSIVDTFLEHLSDPQLLKKMKQGARALKTFMNQNNELALETLIKTLRSKPTNG